MSSVAQRYCEYTEESSRVPWSVVYLLGCSAASLLGRPIPPAAPQPPPPRPPPPRVPFSDVGPARWVRPAEAAEHFGMGRSSFYRLVKSGQLPSQARRQLSPRHVLYDLAVLDAWLRR